MAGSFGGARREVLERYFKLAENRTTVRREMLGGLTTFMTMAYIVVANPQILAHGMFNLRQVNWLSLETAIFGNFSG